MENRQKDKKRKFSRSRQDGGAREAKTEERTRKELAKTRGQKKTALGKGGGKKENGLRINKKKSTGGLKRGKEKGKGGGKNQLKKNFGREEGVSNSTTTSMGGGGLQYIEKGGSLSPKGILNRIGEGKSGKWGEKGKYLYLGERVI